MTEDIKIPNTVSMKDLYYAAEQKYMELPWQYVPGYLSPVTPGNEHSNAVVKLKEELATKAREENKRAQAIRAEKAALVAKHRQLIADTVLPPLPRTIDGRPDGNQRERPNSEPQWLRECVEGARAYYEVERKTSPFLQGL